MTVAPMPTRGNAQQGQQVRPLRLGGTPPVRRPPSASRIARRRWTVGIVKRVLPLIAMVLLLSLALWPELVREADRARISYRIGSAVTPEDGQLIDARYHGVDERGRPYTMTAATAKQIGPERIDLTEPKGDVSLENGNWLMIQSHAGVYIQHAGKLDLSDDVTLYRDDGTALSTSSATVDLKAGAAAGAELTHVEGPFGTLDAQGFALVDKGSVIQFSGPGHLVLNGKSK
jgi:lipopolysaccharide export system protein LptC